MTVVTGPQLIFNVAGSYNPTTLNDLRIGTPDATALTLTSLPVGEARQSDKIDLTATRAPEYTVMAAIEWVSEPVTGETVDFYWAPSPSGTAAQGNPGYVVGSDSAYAGGVATLAEGLKQLDFIGSLVASADIQPAVHVAVVGVLRPVMRYGTLVVFNDTVDIFNADAIEMAVTLTPIIPQAADAV